MATTFLVPDGRVAMAATTYTGNGSTQTISNAVNSISFKPDFVWYKSRNITAYNHGIFDSVRGVNAFLASNLANAEATYSGVSAFNSDGFSLGTDAGGNASATNYIAWQWNAGGATVTNGVGTISSQVRANTTAGFSVVTYTGTGANATVGHGLGVVPGLIIVKNRTSGVPSWRVYHSALPYTSYLYLDTTNAAFTGGGVWTQTPTTTLFGINGTDAGVGTANNYVAYCWAPVAGYSAFGSYVGNGSADGPFIYTGFRPRFILVKSSSNASTPWQIFDTSINPYNTAVNNIAAHSAVVEPYDTASPIDFLSNGFKLRGGASSWNNYNTGTWIYAAFAENPLKYSNAR